MAKKKNEKISPFVPVEEQPYQVPGNWCWTYGDKIFKPMETKKPNGATFAYIDIDSIDNVNQCVKSPKITETTKAPSRASRGLHAGDTMFSLVRPYLKNIAYVDESLEDCIASTGFYVCSPVDGINSKYIYWLMTSSYVVDGLNQYMKGDNSPSIRSGDIENYPFPLPPIAEQQRIVDRIEGLFAKLDEAKDKAQEALESFETRKDSMLQLGFSGELTKGWRARNKIDNNSWVKNSIKECCTIGSGGTPSRKHDEYYKGNIPWIKTGEILWNKIYDSEEKISEGAVENSSAKVYPRGTVLVAMYGQGMTRGRAAILEVEATTNQAVCALQPHDNLMNSYLYYYFMANYWDYRDRAVGGNQPNYSATMIGKWVINIPILDEQVEIVRILDDFFVKEAEAKEKVEATLETIETMRKAILAKAFRGELGTNNPEDESAEELLKRTLS